MQATGGDVFGSDPSVTGQEVWRQPSHAVSTLNHLLASGTREDLCWVDPVTWHSDVKEAAFKFEIPRFSGKISVPTPYELRIKTLENYECSLSPGNPKISNCLEECRSRAVQLELSLFVFIEQVIAKLNQFKQSELQLVEPSVLNDHKITSIHDALLTKTGGVLGTDLQLSLLAASMNCYRRSTLISCFHDHFSDQDARQTDFKRAEQALKDLPPLSNLLESGETSDEQKQPSNSKERYQTLRSLPESSTILLQWILSFKIRFISVDVQYRNLEAIKIESSSMVPDYQFDAVLPQDPYFDELCEKHGSFTAFHGSPTENWYSILRKGLQNMSNTEEMSTGAAFGEGIYFSDDLVVSRIYSKVGECWSKSQLGSKLSVVGVYKIANVPGGVKTRRKTKEDSKLQNDVPEKYHVVRDSSYIRLESLLIWKTDPKAQKRANSHSYTIILAYVVLLVALVLFQVDWKRTQNHFWRFFRRL